ncbi:MAG TPA: hypothetical protein VMO26_17270 [Vicinamibacterales bacterium]|nr:hypothetical protein [Vicinamibacterales bacterium]
MITSLPRRDQLRFAFYYRDGLSLSAVGQHLAEHESTSCRQLAQARGAIRRAVETTLRSVHGLKDQEVQLCLECLQNAEMFDRVADVLPSNRRRKAR